MNSIKYYEILGVTPYANEKLINKAYSDMKVKSQSEGHTLPDEVEKAYEVLSDPMERQLYNESIDYDSLDLYQVIGIVSTANGDEIKKAFRTLSKFIHPDLNRSDDKDELELIQDNFKTVLNAIETLQDETKRRAYDSTLVNKNTTSSAPQASTIFNRRADQTYEIDGVDKVSSINITFAQSILGGQVKVPVELNSTCGYCMGKGTVTQGAQNGCDTCGGAGKIDIKTVNVVGIETTTKKNCPDCNKLTQTVECSHCEGTGTLKISLEANVDIPAGISGEQKIRVAGMGEKGIRGGKDGDLMVTVTVIEDDRFQRDEDDLLYWHDITYTQAMLGTTIVVPSPRGDKEIVIPPLTRPDTVMRFRREGFPSNKGLAGSLIVHLNLVIPTELNDELRAKLIALEE